ncbi:RALF-like 34 [Olea europaea subsp. europaea]|uniref:RALF-like 34 n=2 Tax=Olea europaea subsp. europaea TaxID=158383 RepID=A0A8S0V2J6_OLEEU|nr:RALF-like 34 [Olea europaea subsp. europaea]
MKSSTKPLFFCFVLLIFISHVSAQSEEPSLKLTTDAALEWPMGMSFYEGEFGEIDEEGQEDDLGTRRSLFWHKIRYYISYGALSANRIPCPPRSGRSYYTHNCFRARGPVNPYTRGCSAITRCRA